MNNLNLNKKQIIPFIYILLLISGCSGEKTITPISSSKTTVGTERNTLIQKAKKAILAGDLVSSSSNNKSAIQILSLVLNKNPSNKEATNLLDKIIATYQNRANKNINEKKLNEANNNLSVSQALIDKYKRYTRQREQSRLVNRLPKSQTPKNIKLQNYYTVKRSISVFEVMRETDVYWKDIVRLNNLTQPFLSHSGTVLRLK